MIAFGWQKSVASFFCVQHVGCARFVQILRNNRAHLEVEQINCELGENASLHVVALRPGMAHEIAGSSAAHE
eukprot:4057334-Alexandrium_andersonii.AAC.1